MAITEFYQDSERFTQSLLCIDGNGLVWQKRWQSRPSRPMSTRKPGPRQAKRRDEMEREAAEFIDGAINRLYAEPTCYLSWQEKGFLIGSLAERRGFWNSFVPSTGIDQLWRVIGDLEPVVAVGKFLYTATRNRGVSRRSPPRDDFLFHCLGLIAEIR